MHSRSVFLLALSALPLVAAHGSVASFGANGEEWVGPMPGSTEGGSTPVRVISTLEPITDPSSQSMKCGPGAASAADVVAEVDAGSDVIFGWRSGGGINWVHRWGPVMLYAYKCPGDASACSPPDGAEWFLIDAAAFYKGSEPQDEEFTGWVQDLFHFNKKVPAQIPSNMENGDYLLRHEIIALHNAMSPGAEYYVSCTQVRVRNGSGTSAKDAGAEMVSIPGVYDREDPGIRVNVFGMDPASYIMPGPKVFGSSSGGSDPDPDPTSSEPPPSSPTTTSRRPTSSSTRRPTGTSTTPQPTSPAGSQSLSQVTCRVRRPKRNQPQRKRSLLPFGHWSWGSLGL